MPPSATVTRRSAVLGAAALAAAWRVARAAQRGRPPNIVFILADDLGYADLSCYGRPDFKTSHIDRIAAEGLRFLQAYANSAVCSATRTALITGRYQDRFDVGLDEPNGRRADVGLPPEQPTLPSLLKRRGYATALVGKWHLGQPPKFGPLQAGYDRFYGIYGGGADYFRHDELIDQEQPAREQGYLTELFGDRAVALVGEFAKQPAPFFLSLHFTAPHWPWEGPQDRAESERVGGRGIAPLMDYDGGSQRTYAQMVRSLDGQVGRVLAALRRAGCEQNTLVVFTSDNGGERYADTWPFTGKKGELLEGGIRVPAIVRWPGRTPAGATSEQVMISMDWLPTLLGAAGGALDPDHPSDGLDLTGTLAGEPTLRARALYWRYNALAQEAVRDGDWKYLKIGGNTFLFNVVDDPLERANLKDREPGRYAQLAAAWQAWNATMLPYTPANFSWTASGSELADHFGSPGSVTPPPSGSASGVHD